VAPLGFILLSWDVKNKRTPAGNVVLGVHDPGCHVGRWVVGECGHGQPMGGYVWFLVQLSVWRDETQKYYRKLT